MNTDIQNLALQFDLDLKMEYNNALIKLGKNKELTKALTEKFGEKMGLKADAVSRANQNITGFSGKRTARTKDTGERHTRAQAEIHSLTRTLAFLKESFQVFVMGLVGKMIKSRMKKLNSRFDKSVQKETEEALLKFAGREDMLRMFNDKVKEVKGEKESSEKEIDKMLEFVQNGKRINGKPQTKVRPDERTILKVFDISLLLLETTLSGYRESLQGKQ